MGRAIFYCVQCSKRVTDADLESGKGYRIGERILCSSCAPADAKASTSKRISAAPRPQPAGTSVRLKKAPAPPPVPASTREAPDRKKNLVLLGGGAAALAAIAVVLVLALRKGEDPAPNAERAKNTADSDAPKPAVVEVPGRAELDKARAFAKAHPEDLAGQQREFTELVWKWQGTETGHDAAREVAAVKTAILAKVAGWMAELNREIQRLVDAKQFSAALRRIEEVKPAHDLPEWRLAVEKRASELSAAGKKLREEEEARAAVEKPVPAVETKPVPKPPSEEARAYQARWEGALARATARDYAAALAELQRAAASIKDADVKGEADEDVALLQRAVAVARESLDHLKQRPRGSGISVHYRDGAGAVKQAGGAILQVDGERVELRGAKGPVFIEWADVTASTLAEIAQRGTFEPRTLAALCALEGEGEAARAYRAELPPKWWAYAEGAAAKIPKPEPSERSAREVYASAEKAYRSMETRAAAIEGYRALRADYASTVLVRAYTDRISRRSESGREYYFAPADFACDGTIRVGKNGRLESAKDSDDPDTIRNFAEVEFAALPGQTYRCWLWVGACCEETFLFYHQGTELTDLDAKKKKISCDPGSSFAVAVKHSIRNLKKTHDDHRPKGVKVHPKTAARWEWVEIVLPKYAAPGAKKLRFMTNQAGFSIGGAVVSALRKAAPPEAELKDLEKVRPFDDPPFPVDPDLVGWWTFDEGSGNRAVDLSGRGHTGKFVGAVQWGPGKIGGGIQTDGSRTFVEVDDAEDLRISGDLTMAVWVRKTAEAPDWVCVLGKGTEPQRNYGLWLEPSTRKYMFQQYGANSLNVYGEKLIEVDTWTHLAATIEQDLVKVYYNGVLDRQDRRAGPPPLSATPLSIGYCMLHSSLTGVLDDARIYRRALSAAEVRAVYDLGK